MDDGRPAARRWDPWPAAVFLLHLGHALWFARRHPASIWDPDLVGYFVWFESWLAGTTALHGVEWFPVPKPLMVAVLGPLGSAPAAFAASAVVAGALGALVYLVAARAFGRSAGILAGLVLLLDVDRAVLTLRSSADLWVAALVFAAIWCTMTRRYVLSALAIGLAALAKPVALPCVLHLLAIDGPDRRSARRAMALAFLAVPLVACANLALLGTPSGSARFFAAFDGHHQGGVMGPPDLIHFVLWVQLKQVIFGSTAAFGLVGLACWLARDRTHLASPVVLVPALLLGGYVAMSAVVPFVPMARFFWTIQVSFLTFVVAGMLEVARRVAPVRRPVRLGLAAVLVCFLADDLLVRQLDYRRRATEPFDRALAFVRKAGPVLAAERATGETVLTSLAFLPWLVWTLDDVRAQPQLVRTRLGDAGDADAPAWVLYAPAAFPDAEMRARLERMLASGEYDVRVADGEAALFVRRDRARALEWTASTTR